jgi:hypothetical protein
MRTAKDVYNDTQQSILVKRKAKQQQEDAKYAEWLNRSYTVEALKAIEEHIEIASSQGLFYINLSFDTPIKIVEPRSIYLSNIDEPYLIRYLESLGFKTERLTREYGYNVSWNVNEGGDI